MKKGFVLLAAVLVLGGAAGCSSQRPLAKPEPGALAPGTAALSINGRDIGTHYAVRCSPNQSLLTITTGDNASGVFIMLSNAQPLAAELVRIRNLNGFTGGYARDLQGNAAVAMAGPVYRVVGTAMGFDSAKPNQRTTEAFTVNVLC